MKEHKIGEVFEHNGEWYQCVEHRGCPGCAFALSHGLGIECGLNGDPHCAYRSDGKPVIFKKLEKVGESYMLEDKKFQKYRVFHTPYIYNKIDYSWQSFADPYYISLEVKQNKKEDMEEKKTNFVGAIDALCKRYNMSDGVRIDFMSELKEIIKDKEKCNLKPFNLEAAKSGKTVCTRDGRKARIICFDQKDIAPIVGLITGLDGKESIYAFYKDGRVSSQEERVDDLMMLLEKKEGWVNVYKDGLLGARVYKTRKEAYDIASLCDYVDTVKISWEE